LMSKEDFNSVFVVKNNLQAMKIICSVHKDFKKNPHVCSNFKKYRK